MTPDQEKALAQALVDIANIKRSILPYTQNSGLIRMLNLPSDPPSGYEGALAVVGSVLKIYRSGEWVTVGGQIYTGRINSDGSVVYLPDGFTCTKLTGSGAYEIDHPLGTDAYEVVVCQALSYGDSVGINSQDSTKFVVVGYSAIAINFQDVAFEFILVVR